MATLHPALRTALERTVASARAAAEKASRAAISTLAVDQPEPFPSLGAEERALRNRLRAELRRVGTLDALAQECAYARWHRMLFARFLAENHLLIHPTAGIAVTLEECAELADEEGEPDGWMVAAKYAAAMLPGIFRPADPVMQLRLAPEGRAALEGLLADIPAAVFEAEDSLGWVYQFWQAQRKQEVNRGGGKVGGDDIAPVTQLFTEPYMVRFLLQNTLGAWWAARHPGHPLLAEMEYLRRDEAGAPAAGLFPHWPATAAELRVLDPCCGSGHFLVALFETLRSMRMAEEGLGEAEAADAVLRDNLFGLELDPRCTQIAAFSLALAAWKAGGPRTLPLPNVACSGLKVGDRLHQWVALAQGDQPTEATLRLLYHLFEQAPDVGSLLDPARTTAGEGIFAQDWTKIGPLLDRALAGEKSADPAASVFGEAARGAARAADLLTRRYHLVSTNVPYLARGKQGDVLRAFIEKYHADGKADLATAFVDRCLRFCEPGGSIAVVTPQNWLFLGTYKALRERLLRSSSWDCVVRLGTGAFETIGGEVVNVALIAITNAPPGAGAHLAGIDASAPRDPAEKARLLREAPVRSASQAEQLRNPDARVVLGEGAGGALLLAHYCISMRGIVSGDGDMWYRCFWETPVRAEGYGFLQSTPAIMTYYEGRQHAIDWRFGGRGMLRPGTENQAYGRIGVAVGQMRGLPCCLYTGELYDNNTAVIVPHDPAHLPAIWCFCSSPEYHDAVRRIDQKLNVTNATLVKVPFDLERWQAVAAERYPDGLPEPDSDDPTQWLFHGAIPRSTEPLHVAVARLLGFLWPRQQGQTVSGAAPVEDDGLGAHADADGVVCLPAVGGEMPAAERLRALLGAAYGPEWTVAAQEALLAGVGFAGKGLDVWLRDGFFAQHARLFHNRPFIWQIWDGARGGFSALVNYHRLDRPLLERLTYTYLGGWITARRQADERGEPGANALLVAALRLQEKLKAILEGEPPHDIYVRWKPLSRQPIGWEPDLNDGVRMNIRPFVLAGILRAKFTINWNKDRGADPEPNPSGATDRLNDLHFTRAQKAAARGLGGA